MLHIFTTLFSLYVIARLIPPLRLPLWAKIALGLLALICALKLSIFRMAFGTLTPDLPRWAMAATGVVHGALILLALLCALRDALLLTLWLARRAFPRLSPLPFSAGQWAAGMLTLALLLSGMAVWQALRVPDVRAVSLTLPRLPQALDGLRIVQLSDLHISPSFPRDWVRAVVEKTNALKPDLIVITGDAADGPPAWRSEDFAPLAGLRAPLGVFACTGNHEYYWGYQGWLNKIRAQGITPLENAHAILETRGQQLVLAGVTDKVASGFGLPDPDMAQALAGAPREAVRIMLAHRPDLVAHSVKERVDLQLSGHTHGGQLFGANQLVARFNNGFLAGVYQTEGTALYVSAGSGLWAGFPLRLFVPSEITEITLRAPKNVP